MKKRSNFCRAGQKAFEVRVTWTMGGTYFVKAESPYEAEQKARDIDCLPKKADSEYLGDMEYHEISEIPLATLKKMKSSDFKY